MKKVLILLLAGLLLFPSMMDAKLYKTKKQTPIEGSPIKTPVAGYVLVNLNETSGLLTLSFVGNVGNVEVTITQNGSVMDYDYLAASSGGSETYDLSGYAVGQYLLTIETSNGFIAQYIIYVIDD